jgi:hypothetical protein
MRCRQKVPRPDQQVAQPKQGSQVYREKYKTARQKAPKLKGFDLKNVSLLKTVASRLTSTYVTWLNINTQGTTIISGYKLKCVAIAIESIDKLRFPKRTG